MTPTVRGRSLTRREAIAQALGAATGAAVVVGGVKPAAAAQGTAPAVAARRVVASTAQTVVETTAGKIRGFAADGVYAFKGVPYAEPAAGERRFMPPVKVRPWTGIRSALIYGPKCPNGIADPTGGDNSARADEDEFLLYRQHGWPRAAEDCLRLNVWTPSTRGGRRPVMVYMHGGGFTGGSGNDLLSYDGANLARRHDVVVVTNNHRLNTLGYLDLSEVGGERYAMSGNAGMLDIVAVLEWVRDNAERFGGDPANVTVFGQSGGGGKISALLGMPAAKGLFHKAILQSGSRLRMLGQHAARRLGAAVAGELGLNARNIGDIHTVRLDRLYGAAQAAAAKLTGPAGAAAAGYGPVVDGVVLPAHPFDPGAPALSVSVPMLVGTNENEMVHGVDNPDVDALTEAQVIERLSRYGTSARPILDAYRREYPQHNPWRLYAAISAAGTRQNAFTQAARKAALGGAPAYQYLFSWRTPVLDSRPGTFHSCEIAFVFDNVDLCRNLTGGDPAGAALATNISRAWVSFARAGNPSHAGLPEWPAFTAARESTMVFDAPCRVRHEVEREGRRLIAQTAS